MTVYSSDEAARGIGRKTIYLDHRSVVYSAPALVTGDVLKMVPVFAGEQVLSVELKSADLDTNGSPTLALNVGDGSDVDRYIAASTIGRAGGLAKHTAGCPQAYTADDTIDIQVGTGAATGAVGNITLSILVK